MKLSDLRTTSATRLRKRLYESLRIVSVDKQTMVVTRNGVPLVALVPVESVLPRTSQKPRIDRRRIGSFCKKHGVREFSLFGSILRNDFNRDSDVDVLLDFKSGKHWSMKESCNIRDDLETMFGRSVDVIHKNALASHTNVHRRDEILNSAKVIYASG